MKKFLSEIAIYIILTISVLFVLIELQPVLYKIFPSDYKRHLLINNILKKETNTPEILIFGDSRGMFGVNSIILQNHLHKKSKAYNLSSYDQDITESSYYYPNLPPSTKFVIQCADISWFNNDSFILRDAQAFSMILSKYKLNKEADSLLPKIHPFFKEPRLKVLFNSRATTRNYLHSILRPFLDNEEYNDKFLDPYFPHIYTKLKHPDYPNFVFNCGDYNISRIPFNKIHFLTKVNNYFKGKGIKYVLILMPINKALCPTNTMNYSNIVNSLNNIERLKVLDLTSLLSEDEFYDHIHANSKGALHLSNEISNFIMTIE